MTVSRRTFITLVGASTAGAFLLGAGSSAKAPHPARVSPAEALDRLKRGNTRAANGRTVQRNYSPLVQTPAPRQASGEQPMSWAALKPALKWSPAPVVMRGWAT